MALIKRMQHFAVEVADAEPSITWYRDVLGFKLTEQQHAIEVSGISLELAFFAAWRCASRISNRT